MKVGRRRLVERSAPGPGRSPKADPRLGVVLYDGVVSIDVAGTIGVVSMAARVLPARGGHDRACGRFGGTLRRLGCYCPARFRPAPPCDLTIVRGGPAWGAQVPDAAMLAFPWASIRFMSPRFAPAHSYSVPPACSTAAPPQPGAAPSPEWRDRWPLTGAGRRGRLSRSAGATLIATTARPFFPHPRHRTRSLRSRTLV
jgi:hypothetical protein